MQVLITSLPQQNRGAGGHYDNDKSEMRFVSPTGPQSHRDAHPVTTRLHPSSPEATATGHPLVGSLDFMPDNVSARCSEDGALAHAVRR